MDENFRLDEIFKDLDIYNECSMHNLLDLVFLDTIHELKRA